MSLELDQIAYAPTTGVRRAHETPLVAATDAVERITEEDPRHARLVHDRRVM